MKKKQRFSSNLSLKLVEGTRQLSNGPGTDLGLNFSWHFELIMGQLIDGQLPPIFAILPCGMQMMTIIRDFRLLFFSL
jgi:hypothetical protein